MELTTKAVAGAVEYTSCRNCPIVNHAAREMNSPVKHTVRRFAYENAYTLIFLSGLAVMLLLTGVIHALVR